MHVGVHQDFKGAHSQRDVGSRRGNGKDIVEGFLPHVICVDGFNQVSTGYSHHGCIHRELQLPRAQLRVGVHTGEPEPGEGEKLVILWFLRPKTHKRQDRRCSSAAPLFTQFLHTQIKKSPGGVLITKGENVSSPLCHTALHIWNNKVQTSFWLVQGEVYVHLQHIQLCRQKEDNSQTFAFVSKPEKKKETLLLGAPEEPVRLREGFLPTEHLRRTNETE